MWNSFFAICLRCGIASRSWVWLSKMAKCICRIWRGTMFNLRKSSSKLYDQNIFDDQFMRDLRKARKSVIIESPFLRTARVEKFIPIFHRLKKRGVAILLNTKPLEEHDWDIQIASPKISKSTTICRHRSSFYSQTSPQISHHRQRDYLWRQPKYFFVSRQLWDNEEDDICTRSGNVGRFYRLK